MNISRCFDALPRGFLKRVTAHGRVKRLRRAGSDDIAPLPDEAIFHPRENPLKDSCARIPACDQQWSSIMWDQLFSLIYRLSCRATLINIGRHHLAR
ncbi:hypothetical protein [Bradyrhizobium ottawaense]|uniref:Uncharacterized protein n=1 Tax=Bradyrhizobium ottawaense TaxID=931866 RepID=A0ABV4FSA2_9BRAD|nr:hypothetical protein [Bradyrhizobium ottawaense]BBO01235.1 hypothetical protein SG09_05850 [Bradyrhizobium ottawaense]GMO20107.1 hypothetical protein BwSF12_09860 [Bradyrhizobium ottawaense]GMO21930.1 hypothetical protein BwSF21_16970 [Bradyrhizobium ottawaense]GMO30874.1 hypothetical protein BwSH14_33210 [Bradyrhizobium ottawaense]GMO57160.1 hypothetical protein BwSG20_07650 [Bradyrhizobium ottawaense]